MEYLIGAAIAVVVTLIIAVPLTAKLSVSK